MDSLKKVIYTRNIEFELKNYQPVEIINERSLLEERLHGLENKEERIKASYREGIDTLEEYKENKLLIQKEREEIEEQLSEFSKTESTDQQDDKDVLLKKVSNIYSIISSDKYTDAQKNAALRQVIDRIVYNRQNDTLKIYYFLYKSNCG